MLECPSFKKGSILKLTRIFDKLFIHLILSNLISQLHTRMVDELYITVHYNNKLTTNNVIVICDGLTNTFVNTYIVKDTKTVSMFT